MGNGLAERKGPCFFDHRRMSLGPNQKANDFCGVASGVWAIHPAVTIERPDVRPS